VHNCTEHMPLNSRNLEGSGMPKSNYLTTTTKLKYFPQHDITYSKHSISPIRKQAHSTMMPLQCITSLRSLLNSAMAYKHLIQRMRNVSVAVMQALTAYSDVKWICYHFWILYLYKLICHSNWWRTATCAPQRRQKKSIYIIYIQRGRMS